MMVKKNFSYAKYCKQHIRDLKKLAKGCKCDKSPKKRNR